MLKEQARAFEGVARVADLGLIAGSFLLSASISDSRHLHGGLAWLPGHGGMQAAISSDQYALLFSVSLLSWIAATQWRATYRSVRAERSSAILWDHLMTGMLWALLIGTSAFFFKLQLVSRSFLTVFIPLATLAVGARRTGEQLLMRFVRTKGFNLRDVVVIGDEGRAATFSRVIGHETSSGYRVVRQVITRPNQPVECEDVEFDEAFVLMGSGAANLENILTKFVQLGKRVHFVPGIFDARLFRQDLTEFAGIPLLTIGGYGLSLPQRLAKRVFDVFASLLLLVVLSPVFAVVAALVRLTSRGPILFSQIRLGESGRPFRIYKFRTMRQDAEKILMSNPALYQRYVQNNYKLPKDEDFRITPLGGLLRSTSLDELPQLFNVLKGEMSLVGPRPVVPSELEKYGDCRGLFISIKPGLTGNWQINGRSNVDEYADRAALDLQYIRDQSLRNDVDILLRTIPAVVLRRGAH